MTVAAVSAEDEKRRTDLLRHVMLPRWLDRCGAECVGEWNRTVGAAHKITVDAP